MQMRKWWLKCAAQNVLSRVPGGTLVNHAFRRPRMADHLDEWTLSQALLHVRLVREHNIPFAGETLLEIGTGWKPIFPLIYRIAGCGRILLVDANRHLENKLFRATVDQLLERAASIGSALGASEDHVRRELDPLGAVTVDSLLRRFRFEYLAPSDARGTGLPDRSIGLISSRAVLEHVPPGDLEAIFRECRRLLAPGGAMIHTIDHSDHFQFGDKSISRVNFLRFSQRWWEVIGTNPLVYQNRLRSSVFVDMVRHSGFEIVHLDAAPDEETLLDLESLPIAEPFRRFSKDELATLTTYLVARPA